MTEMLLKLLGVPANDAVHIAGATLALRGGLSVGWYVLIVLVVAGLVAWIYKVTPVTISAWRRNTLVTLRVVFLALLLGLLLRPVLAFTVEGSIRRVLVLLVDGSASMQIADPRLDANDLKRAAIAKGALNAKGGLKQTLDRARATGLEHVSRLELTKAALANAQIDLLPRLDREFDLSAFTFGQGLAELSARKLETNTPAGPPGEPTGKASTERFDWVDRLEASAGTTAMGDAIRETMNRKRGQPLAGIVLVTDGVNNAGSQPRDAAAMARADGIPLYVYGVGITSPRDIIVQNLFAPDVTFVKDEVQLTVRVRAQGLSGESAELQLKLDDREVASKTLMFTNDTELVVPLKFTPGTLGEFALTASIAARADEAVKDNNSRSQQIRVIDSRIKVLLAEQTPRWEFKYLQMMLLRDRRVDLKCFLAEGDKAISRAPDSPYLPEFPARRDELFQYDLVILGDLDPRILTAQHQENLNKLVSDFGGALVVLAGKQHMPGHYRRSALDRLLPVEFDPPILDSRVDPIADRPIQLQLTAAGRSSAMLRLSDREDDNLRIWGQLPPIYWAARVSRAKPAAEVLVVDPDVSKESRFGKMPVMAVQQYGLGQVVYVGTDNLWRWRKNAGDVYYTAVWGQIAQRVSIQRLLGVSRRTQLSADRQNYLAGDRVTVFARLYTGAGYEPLEDPQVKGGFALKNGQGPRTDLALRPVPDQPGMYRGEFIATGVGTYGFSVENDPETVLDFSVTEPRFEFGETAMNEPLLKELAATTGGRFFREEDLHELPAAIAARSERVQSPMEVELWASPLYFLILLAVVTAEWVLRKMSHLK